MHVVIYQLSSELATKSPVVMGPYETFDEAKACQEFLLEHGYRWVRISILVRPLTPERYMPIIDNHFGEEEEITMDTDEAREVLSACQRSELRDHAFGDKEVYWTRDGEDVGVGYFGGGRASVWIHKEDTDFTADGETARELSECGTLKHVERNDEMGPDTYVEDKIMHGLTKEGVLEELTREE